MDFFDLLTMLGGLAFFLYGMKTLGDGLVHASGGRLEKILERLTNKPLKAVLVGAGVTAVIQSSSATTVMVVGFVNSGIMKLQQAVGIIMGANVGTTITAWILGATGIDGDSFLVRMCKPTSFSPILAIVGMGFLMFSHKEKRKNAATILVGFAILMFGMDTMSGAVKPLADVPGFANILLRFSNPVLGMLAGLVLTAVIQSSSASVGVLQALCATGAVGYSAAIPIIMGQNIGTCVTALLSSVGANKNARRAALVHLYFNMIGTILFMALFYIINAVKPFPFLSEAATPFGIAAIHSIFNLTATMVLLPFSKGLVKLVCLTLRDDEETAEKIAVDASLHLLDTRFLERPSYAVEQSRIVAADMARLTEEAMDTAMGLLEEYTEKNAAKVRELEEQVDRYEDEIGSYLVKLSARALSVGDNHTLTTLLHCIGDFERISDHAMNICGAAMEMQEKKLAFSDKAKKELLVFRKAVHDIMHITVESFQEENLELARQVEPMEEVIDGLNTEVKRRHVKRLQKGKCTIELGFILADITTSFERASDHCSNIAACLLEVSENEFDTHAYIHGLREGDNTDFRGRVMVYRENYKLP